MQVKEDIYLSTSSSSKVDFSEEKYHFSDFKNLAPQDLRHHIFFLTREDDLKKSHKRNSISFSVIKTEYESSNELSLKHPERRKPFEPLMQPFVCALVELQGFFKKNFFTKILKTDIKNCF